MFWMILAGLGLLYLLFVLAVLRANWFFTQADREAERAFDQYMREQSQPQRKSA